jgi:2-(3-amino-3-carboxypropyl)histidine synthase
LQLKYSFMEYDLELQKAIGLVKQHKAQLVAVQLPDGLKPKAKAIVDAIHEGTSARVVLWGGSCYGACDIPQGLEKLGVDLLIQFGHSEFK